MTVDEQPPRPDHPAEEGVPAPPGPPPQQPAHRASRRWWLIVGGGILTLVVVVGLVASLGDGTPLPADEAFGLPRIESEEVEAFEDALGSIEIGDLEMDVAVYGEGGEIEVIVSTYRNVPETFSVDGMVRGGAGGIIGSGGSADVDAISTQEIDGVGYVCVPFEGQLMPSTAAGAPGVACGWAVDADTAMMLMDTTTTDAGVAATHAAELQASQG